MKVSPLTQLIVNLLVIIFLISIIFFGGYYLYQKFVNPEADSILSFFGTGEDKNVLNVSSQATQLLPNLRFSEKRVSYFMSPECSSNPKATNNFRLARDAIEEGTGIITFHPESKENADILVTCSKETRETAEGSLIAGEGGVSQYLKSTTYPVILKANVSLNEESSCDYPVVAVHELLHAFGFEHISNPEVILYPYVRCNQRIDSKMIEMLKNIYAIESLPDVYFNMNKTEAIRDGNYFNLTVQIENKGLVNSKSVVFNVYADGTKIFTRILDEVSLDAGSIIFLYDARLPSDNTLIKLELISTEKELNKENNIVELKV